MCSDKIAGGVMVNVQSRRQTLGILSGGKKEDGGSGPGPPSIGTCPSISNNPPHPSFLPSMILIFLLFYMILYYFSEKKSWKFSIYMGSSVEILKDRHLIYKKP